ncbi:MAG: hypothetical protein LBQ36_06315, partial [Synergistaceae bacterium]|nr:hypothetical protein [Synergistaceae bacterium]
MILLAVLAVGILIGVYLKNDLDLAKYAMLQKLPDITVERLDFARVIQEKEWHIKALDAESESGMIRARSLDIEVTEP